MQVKATWRAAALAGALLLGACSKEKALAPVPAPQAQPEKAAAPAAPATEQEPQAAAPTAEPAVAPEEDNSPPPEFKVGMSRDEVMKRFGTCAERKVFRPGLAGSLYVEIYQAKADERCRKRLGERHFTIRGGSLYQITPGLIPPETPRTEPTEG